MTGGEGKKGGEEEEEEEEEEEGDNGSLFTDQGRRGLKEPRLPRQRLPQMILFSSCSRLFLHRFTSKGKAPHREQDVIGGLLSTL